MKVRYTAGALADLAFIASYIKAYDPKASRRVARAIRETVNMVGRYPKSGRAQDIETVRKSVVPRYGYLIYYDLNEVDGSVAILMITHPSQERPHQDR